MMSFLGTDTGEFAVLLTSLRNAARLSQEELAERAHLNVRTQWSRLQRRSTSTRLGVRGCNCVRIPHVTEAGVRTHRPKLVEVIFRAR
jgi:hypothetical protein